MPRWLIVSVLALLLSCLGFGAAAQNPASDDRQQGCASQVQASSASPFDDHAAADTADASTAPGEAAADHGLEAIGGSHQAFVPVLLSEPAPRPAAARAPSPAPERLQRPPRGGAFVA
ncbi:hypothetical protein J7E70_17355 [Variovorax paradoxus]|nr:hypothetical protein [Variovorax paradoxus]MBT2302229.1 hypothetical protein [Variovorax paradoxus]